MKRSLCLFLTFTGLQAAIAQNKFNATGNAGIGTVNPSTSLELLNHTLNVNTAPFITIHNRGSNGTYTNTHVLGGVLGAAYRDVRDPAYVSGMWFERKSTANGLSSQGEIVFGTTAVPMYLSEGLPAERMRITSSGSVGIGTATPQSMLDVKGVVTTQLINFDIGGSNVGYLGRGGTITGGWGDIPDALSVSYMKRDFVIGGWAKTTGTWMGASLFINSDNGNVLIGKTTQANTAYKMDVNGSIRANKIVVNSSGADFVFDPAYQLPSLQEVENFIKEKHHLPGITPAAAMQEHGLDVGDNQTRLLQKIEELTLYVIALNKQVQLQQEVMAAQAVQLEKLMKGK